MQVEVNEAEVESLMANVKRNKEPPQRARDLGALNVRHKLHTERLEQVQRALANEAISVAQVDALKDTIEMYIVRPLRCAGGTCCPPPWAALAAVLAGCHVGRCSCWMAIAVASEGCPNPR